MTEAPEHPIDARRSPHSIRRVSFSRERKGWSTGEVREYLRSLADQIEAADAERTRLRAELDRQRHEMHRLRNRGPQDQREPSNEPDAQAVALFSQAQQVADRLIEEAVQQARDLMSTARKQQRDILQQAHSSAEAAVHSAQQRADPLAGGSYEPPVPEVEYVRTFAKVAQVQLRSVLEALTEQVDRLGSLPELEPEQPERRPDPTRSDAGPGTNPQLGLRDLEWQAFSSGPDKRSY